MLTRRIYDAIKLLDKISLPNVLEEVKNGEQVTVVCGGKTFKADCEVSERQRHALLAGGTLLYARQQNKVSLSGSTGEPRGSLDSHIFFC